MVNGKDIPEFWTPQFKERSYRVEIPFFMIKRVMEALTGDEIEDIVDMAFIKLDHRPDPKTAKERKKQENEEVTVLVVVKFNMHNYRYLRINHYKSGPFKGCYTVCTIPGSTVYRMTDGVKYKMVDFKI